MLIDSHCHIPLISDNKSDQALIIKNAVEVGVTHMLCISVDLETVEDVCTGLEITNKFRHQ